MKDLELKKVKEWLPDRYEMSKGTEFDRIMGRYWECEVDSVWHARAMVNQVIRTHIAWISGFSYDFETLVERSVEQGFCSPDF